jgi:pimeloyl-ACP methyl ester carboxylesterase
VKGFLFASKEACARRMEQVGAPVLLVMGSRDPDFKQPAAQAQRWADRLHGRAVIVEGSGHYPHVDAPDVVADHIHEWLGAALSVAA